MAHQHIYITLEDAAEFNLRASVFSSVAAPIPPPGPTPPPRAEKKLTHDRRQAEDVWEGLLTAAGPSLTEGD